MTLPSGTRLGPHDVLSLLGAGGMGEVYKARDTRLDRTVAIKVLPADLASDLEFRARFEREAKAISQLNHPHICTLPDVEPHGSGGAAPRIPGTVGVGDSRCFGRGCDRRRNIRHRPIARSSGAG
jgi:serine/threonine protein kinase